MRHIKKLLSLLLTGVMLVALVSCGSTVEGPSNEPSESEISPVQSNSAEEPEWPKRTITIVVGYAPGGDLDVNARAYADRLSEILGVDVVVSNVTGSSGAVAAQQVKDSEPDGYTVFYHQPALMISKLQGMTDFGIEAYELSCMAAFLPGDLLCVNKSLGITTLEELYSYTLEHPGELNLAAAPGTMNYIQALQMQSLGFDINIVDGGDATGRVANLLGGHVNIILNSYSTVKDYLTTGDFVALGTLSSERAKAYSEIPTAIEQGYEIYFDKYHYFAFPKGTDEAIVEAFAAAVKQINESEDYSAYLRDELGEEPFYQDAEDALATLDSTWEMLQDYADALAG